MYISTVVSHTAWHYTYIVMIICTHISLIPRLSPHKQRKFRPWNEATVIYLTVECLAWIDHIFSFISIATIVNHFTSLSMHISCSHTFCLDDIVAGVTTYPYMRTAVWFTRLSAWQTSFKQYYFHLANFCVYTSSPAWLNAFWAAFLAMSPDQLFKER